MPPQILTSSSAHIDGHLVVIEIPDGASFRCRWHDGTDQDVTGWIPDLIVIGAVDSREQRRDGRPEPEQTVQAANLSYLPPPEPTDTDQVIITYAHSISGTVVELELDEALALSSRGIATQLTAGAASQVAVPTDASALTDRR